MAVAREDSGNGLVTPSKTTTTAHVGWADSFNDDDSEKVKGSTFDFFTKKRKTRKK
jgi:hypothetical protein